MVKHESRRSFSFGYLIPKVGLVYLLSISSMILSVLAVNLIPNDAISEMTWTNAFSRVPIGNHFGAYFILA